MNPPSSYPNPRLASWRLGEELQRPGVWYRLARRFLQVTFSALWRVRVFDRHHEPASGGVLYVCNHQSFLDPVLMSLALRRPMNYMARETLFHHPLFRRLIDSLNAFPVRRGTADLGALKEAMRRVRRGGQVVVFAEGTRTTDGRIGPLLPGVAMLAQRAADWIVPVVIDGAFEAWPRKQPLPGPGSIVVRYAPPIPREEARRHEAPELMDRLRRTLIELQRDLRQRVGRPEIRYE